MIGNNYVIHVKPEEDSEIVRKRKREERRRRKWGPAEVSDSSSAGSEKARKAEEAKAAKRDKLAQKRLTKTQKAELTLVSEENENMSELNASIVNAELEEGKKKGDGMPGSERSFADESTKDQSGISGFFSSMFSVCGTERGGMCTTKPKAEQPLSYEPRASIKVTQQSKNSQVRLSGFKS